MGIMHNVPHQEMLKRGGGVNGDNMNGAPSQLVENGQVVDWDKVPPHLRGYYSKVFGVQPGGGRSGQQQQQQQAGMSPEMQRQADLAAAQAIQSIGNEAIGAENSIKVPELEQHEFQQHLLDIEGVVPLLGEQQSQQQQEGGDKNKDELAKQQLEQVHQRQQAEAEQKRQQMEAEQQQQQQQQQVEAEQQQQQQKQQQQKQQQQQVKEMELPSEAEMNAMNKIREENAKRIAQEEEQRRKKAEEEALQKAGNAEEALRLETMKNAEKMKKQREDAAAQNVPANANEALSMPVPAAASAGVGAEQGDDNATLESLQSELNDLMNMMKERTGGQ